MTRTSRPLALIAAVLALAASGCGVGGEEAGGADGAATSTACDEHGVQLSLTPAGRVGDRTFMAIGLAEPVELDADQVLDLGAWQLTGVPAAPIEEPVEPATDRPEEPPCPEGGFHVTVVQGDAAMGLRTSGIELVNCGTADIAIDGYPVIEIPGVDVAVRHGSDTIQDPGPTPITLAPGEAVSAGMVWRNLVEGGDVVNATEINVGYAEGSPLETVTPEAPIDLGTTREIEVTAWRAAD